MKIGDILYSTEYALTLGIRQKKLEFWSQTFDPHIFAKHEDALKHAEEMRKKEIISLKQKIEKLENMNF